MIRLFCSVSVSLALAFGFGCQHTERADRDEEDAGSKPDSAPMLDGSPAKFGAGACHACISPACGTPVGVCNGEPSCAAYLSCVEACPADPDGTAAATCVAACPPAAGSAPAAAQSAVDGCFAAAAAACVACGGGTPDAGADAGFKHPILRQRCAPSNLGTACDQCQFEHCCDSVSDSLDDGGAAAELAECWLACATGDYACEAACYEQYPEQIPAFGGYDACLGAHCIGPNVCPTRGGPCAPCIHRACAEEQAACFTNTDCYLARACIGACETADPSCGIACRARYPNGAVYLDALLVCGGQHCIEACGG
jgi:hypothetical protein